MHLEELQNTGLLLIGPIEPDECLFVVAESQISGHKSSSWNVTLLLAMFQFVQKTKGFGATPSMRVRPDQHAEHRRTPIAESERLFQNRNCLVRLTVSNQHETQEPVGSCVVRIHCQYASQL